VHDAGGPGPSPLRTGKLASKAISGGSGARRSGARGRARRRLRSGARPRRSRRTAASSARPGGGDEDERLTPLSDADRSRVLLDLVRTEVAAVLDLASEDSSPQRSLFELGLNSLLAIDLRRRLSLRIGSTLPAALLFDAPTIHKTATSILRQIEPELSVPGGHDAERRNQGTASASRSTSLNTQSEPALAVLLRQAHAAGKGEQGWQLLDIAADIRYTTKPCGATTTRCDGLRRGRWSFDLDRPQLTPRGARW
jgi:aryl carrier-like protein